MAGPVTSSRILKTKTSDSSDSATNYPSLTFKKIGAKTIKWGLSPNLCPFLAESKRQESSKCSLPLSWCCEAARTPRPQRCRINKWRCRASKSLAWASWRATIPCAAEPSRRSRTQSRLFRQIKVIVNGLKFQSPLTVETNSSFHRKFFIFVLNMWREGLGIERDSNPPFRS